ncbi:hypothetical protein ACXX9E_29485 [Pseudomonas sp. GNP014]
MYSAFVIALGVPIGHYGGGRRSNSSRWVTGFIETLIGDDHRPDPFFWMVVLGITTTTCNRLGRVG